MIAIHSFLFVCHIIFGSMALLLFWAPVASKKGSLDHVKFGGYYGKVMYAVALSGALMAVLVIYDPMVLKGAMFKPGSDAEMFTQTIRIFWGFLLYLSLLTYVSVRQGFAVLKYKQNLVSLRKTTYVLPLVVLFIGGVSTLVLGIQAGRTLHIIFGVLGMLISAGMLRYCFAKQLSPNQWVIEHFSAMIGSGIGAYTAFLAFGGRQIFENLGNMQLIFWIAPGVAGSVAITILSRNYSRKFNKSTNNPL